MLQQNLKYKMEKELELYIHIPFCVRKCNYCDFVSFAGCEDKIKGYVDALIKEICQCAPLFAERKIRSVYIGGGTPSLLEPQQLKKIVDALHQGFHFRSSRTDFMKELRKGFHSGRNWSKKRPPETDSITEFSIECNPGTVDRQKLRAWRKMGINRLSIGLQSTDNRDLQVLGRIHTYEDFEECFRMAREAGFENINVDLMQAIPGQTLNSWKRVLSVVCTWRPEHISAYSLIIEEGTPFYRRMQDKTLLRPEDPEASLNNHPKDILFLPDEDTERQIYYYTKEFLEKSGYQRYEISNYALPGYACVHNIGYWQRTDYLGLGLNASSLVDNTRWKNTADLAAYLQHEGNPLKIREEEEHISHKEQMEEFMITGLRMMEGVSKTDFIECFGQDFDFTYGEKVRHLCSLGLLTDDRERVYLTDRGVDVSNRVLAEFLL